MLERLTSRLDTLYGDAGKVRARVQAGVLLTLALGSILVSPSLVALRVGAWPLAAGIPGAAAVLAGALGLLLAGRLDGSRYWLAVGWWVVVSLVVALPAGITAAEGAVVLLVSLALTSLVLDRREAVFVMALYVVTVVAVGLAQANGVAVTALATQPDAVARGAALVVGLVVAGLAGPCVQAATAARHAESQAGLSEPGDPLAAALLSLGTARSLEEVYRTLLASVARIAHAGRVRLFTPSPAPEAGGTVALAATWQAGQIVPSELPAPHTPGGVPMLLLIANTTQMLVIDDPQHSARLPEEVQAGCRERATSALVIVPLADEAMWYGALVIEVEGGQAFSEEQARLCGHLADVAVAAAHRHSLVTTAQQAAQRERALRVLTDAILDATSQQEAQQVAEEGLARLLGRSPEDIRQARLGDGSLLSEADLELLHDIDRRVTVTNTHRQLLEHTQQVMLQEHLVSHITAELQRSAGVDGVLQVAAEALRSTLDGYDVTVRLKLPADDRNGSPAGAVNEAG